ncbi:SDR family NAD(P)-dependent oxidoreductase [Nocardioides pyridinolyticus]
MAETFGFAFVTGGGSGIGRASAVALARQGLPVIVADRAEDDAATTADLIRQDGGEATPVSADVTAIDELQRAVSRGIDLYGPLAAAVNSAGIQGQIAPAAECAPSNWDAIIGVNLTGTFLSMQVELEAMLRHGSGSIVNVASNFGLVGQRGMPAYCASKHGVIGLSKSASLDYATSNIRVNVVSPGPIGTPLLDSFVGANGSHLLDAIKESVPMGRVGTADEVGEAIAWLAGPSASYVTGAVLTVDGGYVVP